MGAQALALQVFLLPPPKRSLPPPKRMAWSHESVLRRLGKPPGWVPATAEEAEAAFEAAIDLLCDQSTKSGYKEVYAVGERWQAKPYVKPGSQRSAGYFASPRAAALRIFEIKMGYEPPPRSPKKGMNKHGMGRKPVARKRSSSSKGGAARKAAASASTLFITADMVTIGEDADAIRVACDPL